MGTIHQIKAHMHSEQEELSLWITISDRGLGPTASDWGLSLLRFHIFWDSQEQVHVTGNTGMVISPPMTLMPAWWPVITSSQWQMWWHTPGKPHHGGPTLPALQLSHSHCAVLAPSEVIAQPKQLLLCDEGSQGIPDTAAWQTHSRLGVWQPQLERGSKGGQYVRYMQIDPAFTTLI